MRVGKEVAVFAVLFLLLIPLVSAGVGLRWEHESALVPEKSNVCLTYGVYNPWPTDSYVKINLSDSLQEIVDYTDISAESIPRYTFSNSSIPVKFCFRTPEVYKEDCALFDTFLCKQECNDDLKVYSGEVVVTEVNEQTVKSGGSGGSSTSIAVSAPLRVKVQCIAHGTDYSIIFIVVGLIALIALAIRLYKRKKKKRNQSK